MHMHQIRLPARHALALASLAMLGGCTATGVAVAAGALAGAATAVYVQGDLETEIDASPTQVAAATEGAFEDLSLTLVSSEATEIDGRIDGRSSDDKPIAVRLALEDGRTKVSIRVGAFGNEELSRLVLEHIRKHLGHSPEPGEVEPR